MLGTSLGMNLEKSFPFHAELEAVNEHQRARVSIKLWNWGNLTSLTILSNNGRYILLSNTKKVKYKGMPLGVICLDNS
jgi:hypothetical protein